MLANANEINAFPSCVVSYPRVHVTPMAHGERRFVRQTFRQSFSRLSATMSSRIGGYVGVPHLRAKRSCGLYFWMKAGSQSVSLG
jgi:hypothetical protein